MGLEQYIVRELKQDIKYLIKKVTEIEKKIDELKPVEKVYTLSHDASGDVYTESEKMQDELEPIVPEEPGEALRRKEQEEDETLKRYQGYRDWNKTHDNYKILHSPTNTDEHGKKIKDD